MRGFIVCHCSRFLSIWLIRLLFNYDFHSGLTESLAAGSTSFEAIHLVSDRGEEQGYLHVSPRLSDSSWPANVLTMRFAARYQRKGPFYTADLITVRIPEVRSLSVCIGERPYDADFWRSVGASIYRFHAGGVYHADMNAHNLQIDAAGDLWMLDLDRGRLLAPGPWQQKTLARLHRSLQKIKAQNPGIHFSGANWEQFLEGYFDASRSA